MVKDSALTQLVLWKAYKRLLALGHWRDGYLGAVNPYGVENPPHHYAKAAARQETQDELTLVVSWAVQRYAFFRKSTSDAKVSSLFPYKSSISN